MSSLRHVNERIDCNTVFIFDYNSVRWCWIQDVPIDNFVSGMNLKYHRVTNLGSWTNICGNST